jgi:thioredoxin-related protein
MPRVIAVLTALLTASIALGADVEGFHNSLDDARKQAKESGKPMYIHFTTTWCGWCRRIENDTYKSETGGKALEGFVPVSLDCTVPRGEQPTAEKSKYIDLMRQLGGRGYPFLAILGADGTVYGTSSGYMPPEPFAQMLSDAAETAKELAAFRAKPEPADGGGLYYHVEGMRTYEPLQSIDEDKAEDYRRLAVTHAMKVYTWDPNDTSKVQKEFMPLYRAEAGSVLLSEHRQDKPVKGVRGKLPPREELLKVILDGDPANEDYILQDAYFTEAMHGLEQIGRDSSQNQRNEALARAETLLGTLTTNAKQLDMAQRVWFVLGKVREMQGKTDQAVVAYKKAVKADPESPGARQIKRMIETME